MINLLLSVMLPTMYAVLSITLGVCVLLIIGATEQALSVTYLIPASVVICPIYFMITRTFKGEE